MLTTLRRSTQTVTSNAVLRTAVCVTSWPADAGRALETSSDPLELPTFWPWPRTLCSDPGSGPDLTSQPLWMAQLQGAEGGKDIQAILAEVDRDGDGQIDYDEFVAMMMKARLPGHRTVSLVQLRPCAATGVTPAVPGSSQHAVPCADRPLHAIHEPRPTHDRLMGRWQSRMDTNVRHVQGNEEVLHSKSTMRRGLAKQAVAQA